MGKLTFHPPGNELHIHTGTYLRERCVFIWGQAAQNVKLYTNMHLPGAALEGKWMRGLEEVFKSAGVWKWKQRAAGATARSSEASV